MGLKIFKAIWFLSMIAVLANVLYIYAGLPETVLIEDAGPTSFSMGKETFFYIVTPTIALINAMVYLVSGVFRKDLDFRAWFHGLIITLNIFFIIALSFIGLYNSGERYEYKSIDFVIYGSIALIAIWALCWPAYSLYRKLKPKELV